ncbi:MAG TPA: MBL fold metallo-hydrolase [Porticoccus sp.]|nr:MBL fold metallo-hydrolase [Porticoccus sp.]
MKMPFNLKHTSAIMIAISILSYGSLSHGQQYWHGDSSGVEWFPTGKNLTYTKSDERIHPLLTEHSRKMDQGIFKVGDNAYMAYGYALTSPVFVDGPTGVIIIDPPEDVEKAKQTLAAFRKYSNKPIVAIMYSHWHVDHYAGVRGYVSDEDVESGNVKIIAHDTFLDTVIASSSGGDGPIIGARVDYSLGTLLDLGPEGRINGGLGPDFESNLITLIPPTDVFSKELDLELGGLKVHFEWVPSEASDEIIAWFPDLKLLHTAEVVQGESFPNLHTIRGSKYREPERWFKTIDSMRRFPAQYMMSSHGRPVSGVEDVANVLTSYRDAIQYVFDQTIRYMNLGYLPDELVQVVTLPKELAEHPWLGDFYGGVKHSVRQIYVGQLGWFEGDPTFLDPLNNIEASKRYIKLMGGQENVISEAEKATAQGDHQWSAELLTHVIRLDKNNMTARQLKANNLREIGFTLMNNNWRNWHMTSALELEGKLDYSKAINLQAPDLVKVFPLSAIFEGLRFRVDGQRLAKDKVNMTLGITISDTKDEFSMTLRNGVMEFIETKPANADIQLTLTTATLASILTNSPAGDKHSPSLHAPIDKLHAAIENENVEITIGGTDDLNKFFSYIDAPNTEKFSITLK